MAISSRSGYLPVNTVRLMLDPPRASVKYSDFGGAGLFLSRGSVYPYTWSSFTEQLICQVLLLFSSAGFDGELSVRLHFGKLSNRAHAEVRTTARQCGAWGDLRAVNITNRTVLLYQWSKNHKQRTINRQTT